MRNGMPSMRSRSATRPSSSFERFAGGAPANLLHQADGLVDPRFAVAGLPVRPRHATGGPSLLSPASTAERSAALFHKSIGDDLPAALSLPGPLGCPLQKAAGVLGRAGHNAEPQNLCGEPVVEAAGDGSADDDNAQYLVARVAVCGQREFVAPLHGLVVPVVSEHDSVGDTETGGTEDHPPVCQTRTSGT